MAKQKRVIYEVRWDKKQRCWTVAMRGETDPVWIGYYGTKAEAEERGRFRARNYWEARNVPTQLIIYTKAGRIGRGSRYEASYGCDSRRRKG